MALMNKRKKKKRPRQPTLEEFLTFKPLRKEFEYIEDEDGLIHITVPKFQKDLGKTFCKTIKKQPTFTADMDAIGSIVWKYSDGDHTVADIEEELKKTFPDEAEKTGQNSLQQRLIAFLQQMSQLDYITLLIPQHLDESL